MPGKKHWVIWKHFDANGRPSHVTVYHEGRRDAEVEVPMENIKSMEAHWAEKPYCDMKKPVGFFKGPGMSTDDVSATAAD